jgi:hypothetical protein
MHFLAAWASKLDAGQGMSRLQNGKVAEKPGNHR